MPSVTADGFCCPTCGEALFDGKTGNESVRQARDIVARWSSDDILDQISSLPALPPFGKPHFPVSNESEQPVEANQLANEAPADAPPGSGPEVNAPPTPAPPSASEHPHDEPPHPEKRETRTVENTQPAPQAPPSAEVTQPEVGVPPIQATPAGATPRIQDPETSTIRPALAEPMGELPDQPVPDKPVQPDADVQMPADLVEVKSEGPPEVAAALAAGAAAAIPKRPEQPRRPQPRPRQRRTSPEAKAKANQGNKPVNRKLRVDVPSDGPVEANKKSAEKQSVNAEKRTPKVTVNHGTKRANSSAPGRRTRIDHGEPVNETVGGNSPRPRTKGPAKQRYIDEGHSTVLRGPHFQMTPQRRTNFTSITGQILAYTGVLGLTVGTVVVIFGHFGGYSEYTPTGWLVTTVAQMMLFLGVINLVSGGIEQTNDDMSQRIEFLGEQLMRIEQVTEEAVRGPKIPARQYQGEAAHETADDASYVS